MNKGEPKLQEVNFCIYNCFLRHFNITEETDGQLFLPEMNSTDRNRVNAVGKSVTVIIILETNKNAFSNSMMQKLLLQRDRRLIKWHIFLEENGNNGAYIDQIQLFKILHTKVFIFLLAFK